MVKEHVKKHLPWAAIALGLGILVSLYKLDMVPWPAKASVAERPTRAEVKARISGSEDAAHKVHEALIQRIEHVEEDSEEFRTEQRVHNEKMDRRTWQILKEMK